MKEQFSALAKMFPLVALKQYDPQQAPTSIKIQPAFEISAAITLDSPNSWRF